MPEADDYVSSRLFPSDQDVELAREAIVLSVAFADVPFLRAAGPDLPYNITRAVERNRPVRDSLDDVLKGFAFSPHRDGPVPGWRLAQKLAARVEAFSYPSVAAECRVIEYSASGEDQKYLVAVSAFTQEFMSHFMWGIPAMRRRFATDRDEREVLAGLITIHGLGREFYAHPYVVDLRELRNLDECIESYLRVWVTNGRYSSPLEHAIPSNDEWMAEASDIYAACAAFLLAHELQHIQGGHFMESNGEVLPAWLARRIPDGIRNEVECDCMAFTCTLYSLLHRSVERIDYSHILDFRLLKEARPFGRTRLSPRARWRQRIARESVPTIFHRVQQATESVLSFYAATDILAATARRAGRMEEAERLERVLERREYVQDYIAWTLTRTGEDLGFSVWDKGEADAFRHVDSYVEHVKEVLVEVYPRFVSGSGR
ncbi:hypothetical protein ACH4C2_06120 [Streptomyces sp. NPDC018057]|uniref:hypothetical protein n=1 Tax=unclassified Streptomyces TaxID=2593676 RepID=UPI0037895EB3